jgi:hypothetical protein
MLEYIRERQRLAAESEAKKEAERVAKMESEARKLAEIAARKKLFLEQQENERLRQKHTQRKEKLAEQKWSKQLGTLLTQIEDNLQKDDKLEEIRSIIERREPYRHKLDWATWLSNPLNQLLADLDYDYAVEMFNRDNRMAKGREGRGGRPKRLVDNYALAFSGDGAAAGGDNDHVKTDFNPNDYDLNLGFTVSYWVRPDIVGAVMFAMGWKGHNKDRFTFGINKAQQIYIGVGGNTLTDSWTGMGVDTSLLEYDGSHWILKTDGTWYHFVVKYADRSGTGSGTTRKVYLNGTLLKNSTINWSRTGDVIDEGMYFGARDVQGSGTSAKYDNGWACAVSQVAIFDTEQSDDWAAAVYNAGRTGTDFTGQSGLVGYWKFDEGDGTTVTDHSENGNDGTFAAVGSATNNSSYPTVLALPTWEKVSSTVTR